MGILEVIIVSVLIMALATAVGAFVQKSTLFIFPWDPATVLTTIAAVSIIICDYLQIINLPFEPYWLIPFGLGYCIGYYINGLTHYSQVFYADVAGQIIDAKPIVVYRHAFDRRTGRQYDCMAEQSWKALFKRWLLNIHHEIDTHGIGWQENWDTSIKYPGFPVFFRGKSQVVESWEICSRVINYGQKWDRKTSQYRPRFQITQYYSDVRIASSDQVPRLRLLKTQRALDEANIAVHELQNKVMDMQFERTTITNIMIADMLGSILDMAPLARVQQAVRKNMSQQGLRPEKEIIVGAA